MQAAIDSLMQAHNQTVILIAHRLSTIRNADKIAFIGEGKVLEYGSHDELVNRPHGRYKRLFESAQRGAKLETLLKKSARASARKGEDTEEEEEEDIDWEAKHAEEEENAYSAGRAVELAKPDSMYMLIGAFGAVLAGGVFPMWGGKLVIEMCQKHHGLRTVSNPLISPWLFALALFPANKTF